MIRFKCICHWAYEVPDDRAGTTFQCPNCGRAVDVPLLSEINTISEDGTYKVDAEGDERQRELQRLRSLQRAYTKQRVDEYGREIDMRLSPDEVKEVGGNPIDAFENGPHNVTPKYDPVTGELVRPVEIKEEHKNPSAAKVPWIRPSVHYGKEEPSVSAVQILPELFRLSNIAVMGAVFAMHFLMQLVMFPIAIRMLLLVLLIPMICAAIVAHYANVIDEIGPTAKDELPRPLRNLDWTDDLGGPFFRFMLALILCYSPLIIALWIPKPLLPMTLIAAVVIGTVFFPATLLTTTTSGTILNLRPDRVLGVIKGCGAGYVMLALTWPFIAIAYLLGFIGTQATFAGFANPDFIPTGYLAPYFSFPMLIGAIYAMHAWCWYLGLMYREHHYEFPWTLQSHPREGSTPLKGDNRRNQTPRRGFEVRHNRAPRSIPSAMPAPVPVDPLTPPQPRPVISRYELDDPPPPDGA